MGRVAKGWSLTCRRGVYGVRWTNEPGKLPRRPEITLGTTDSVEASRLAPLVYAEHISGKKQEDGSSGANCIASPTTKLDGLIADWLDAVTIQLGRGVFDIYLIYGRHWLKHLKTLGDVRPARIDDYQNARLKSVLRKTVKLELSAMRRFFKWLKVREYIRQVPEFPELGENVLGTKYHVPRRAAPVNVMSAEQMDEVIDSMDEWSIRKVRGKKFPVKARFLVARETGLRPITIDNLIGRDVTVSGLHIRDENDKNRWGRVVPLSDRARAALESVLPEDPDELIFGEHHWGPIFYRYTVKTFGENSFTPYDLKHGRVTELFDSGAPETGIQFLTGTTSLIRTYSHPTRRAAEEALKSIRGTNGGQASRGRGEQRKKGRKRAK
jgi:integrase